MDLEEVKVVPESAYESEWPTLHQAVHRHGVRRSRTLALMAARVCPW